MTTDTLKRMPNQDIENRPTECVAETVCDILGNAYRIPFDPGFTYAMTLRLERSTPTTAGSDPLMGMQSAILYGVLETSQEPFDATTVGELYEANWQNYTDANRQDALKWTQNGIISMWTFADVVAYLKAYNLGVSFPMRWYQNFNVVAHDGNLPIPAGLYSDHNINIVGITDDNRLIAKPWLGPDYGDGGYCYLSESIFNQVQDHYYAAYGFNPGANRIFSIISICLTRLRLP